ncbi:hypothetical protein [uncultured Aquimarina sp.]|uniref:hypothetical protein n=1 Tax=uncultured Aquimarina sp. TaxID=575652 RepID=UPI00262BC764|nr:hypothetical protein [uncultured Aquimarina sp.]
MSKEIFLRSYLEKVNQNYNKLEYYLNDRLVVLSPLNLIKDQIINCLMIEQNIAAITISNHFLERMLKLALIEKEIYGLKIRKDNNQLNLKLDKAYKKYDRLILSDSISEGYNRNLINEEEKKYLKDRIKDDIRNAYSHAEMEKVNKGKPENMNMFQYNLNEVNEKLKNQESLIHNEINVSTKVPSIQSDIQRDRCNKIAYPYFESLYQIAKNIDARLDIKKEFYK